MSWVAGQIVINDTSKKSMDEAYAQITSAVRRNADLEEFPGMCGQFRIRHEGVGKIFSSYDDAEDYLNSISNKWARNYNVMAAFYDTSAAKETKTMLLLKERINKEREKLKALEKSSDVRNFKSAYVGCPECGSKLNKNYINRNCCPLCGTNLTSETNKKRMQGYKDNIKKWEKDLTAACNKQKEKLPVRYLVMFEEHIG